jgi:hypothetical protein
LIDQREKNEERETVRFVLTDQEHLAKLRPFSSEFVYRPPSPQEIENDPILKANNDLAQMIANSEITITLREPDAKSKSKSPKKTTKKANPKPNKSAVADIQS